MQPFRYEAPRSLAEAVGLLEQAGPQARVLSGGTDLLVQLREGHRQAELVVDVKRIPELMAVRYSPREGLSLGAAVACQTLYENHEVAAAYPGLIDAARIIGGWQIQSRASLGGNLCNSSPAADAIAPLMVHQAVCRIAGPAGERRVNVSEFCLAPGKNILQRGEVLVALELPPPAAWAGAAYQRFIPRNEMDIAVVGVAAWVQLAPQGDTLAAARLALAAVAPTPVVATSAAAFLAGQRATPETFAAAGELAKESARPISDMRGTAEFRTHLVGVLVARTLAAAVQRARSVNAP